MTSTNPHADEPLTTAEVLGWAELATWTMLVFAPIVYYIHGPSVSTDQRVVRMALVILAACGAVTLRIINWRHSRRRRAPV